MKIHRNLVDGIIFSVREIFGENRFADSVIEKTLKSNKKWGSRDRGFIAETVYDIVRWWRLYWYLLEEEPKPDETSLWKIVGISLVIKGEKLPEMDEFADVDVNKVKMLYKNSNLERKIRESIPDWLDELGQHELKDRWDDILHSLNMDAPVFLRANRLRVSPEKLRKKLQEEDIHSDLVTDNDDALKLKERKNVFRTKAFKQGLFEVQDAGSQHIAPFLEVEPQMRVIDACAGGGGKSLHLGALMQNKGKVIALDIHDWKLKELHRRAKRNGLDIIETRAINSTKVIKRLKKSADRVLLDVPCSGLGVLRRNPDAKWKLNPERIESLKKTQEDILERYSGMVKEGGILVYATCSILPSENEFQVRKFLERHKNEYKLVAEKYYYPDEKETDGFYMAKIRRL